MTYENIIHDLIWIPLSEIAKGTPIIAKKDVWFFGIVKIQGEDGLLLQEKGGNIP